MNYSEETKIYFNRYKDNPVRLHFWGLTIILTSEYAKDHITYGEVLKMAHDRGFRYTLADIDSIVKGTD